MELRVGSEIRDAEVDVVVVGIRNGAKGVEGRYANLAGPLFASGDLPLKPMETLMVPGTPRTVFVGLAENADAEAWRRASATVVRRFRKARRFAFAGGDPRAIAEGVTVGSRSMEPYKTSGETTPSVERVIVVPGEAADIERGRVVGESINWNNDDKPRLPKGPSGVAVRTLVEFATTFDL